jgi:Arc/MetJ family transcription regulator
VIDQELMEQAKEVAGTETMRDTVDVALRELVRRRQRRRLEGLRGLGWEGDLSEMRGGPPGDLR